MEHCLSLSAVIIPLIYFWLVPMASIVALVEFHDVGGNRSLHVIRQCAPMVLFPTLGLGNTSGSALCHMIVLTIPFILPIGTSIATHGQLINIRANILLRTVPYRFRGVSEDGRQQNFHSGGVHAGSRVSRIGSVCMFEIAKNDCTD